jgi:D-alanyl-D-alanine carboxypeptidase
MRLRFRTLSSANGITASYGLGISSVNGFLGHTGEILGYNLAMYYLPRSRATIVVITNMTTPSPAATTVFVALAKYFFPARFPSG